MKSLPNHVLKVLNNLEVTKPAGDWRIERIIERLTHCTAHISKGRKDLAVSFTRIPFGELAASEQDKLRDEKQKAELASNLKIGPKVFEGPRDSGVLVRNWIEGEELTPSSGAEFVGLAAQLCHTLKTLHGSSVSFSKDWNIMVALKEFRGRLTESERKALMEDGLVEQLSEIHVRLSDGADRVPCHNDCFPKNWVRESSEVGRILLIDFEYAGNNHAEFDLATLWNEFELSEAKGLDLIVHQYYGKGAPVREQKRARILLNALLVDAVWAHYAACMKSSELVWVDFDRIAQDRLSRMRRRMATRAADWLEDAGLKTRPIWGGVEQPDESEKKLAKAAFFEATLPTSFEQKDHARLAEIGGEGRCNPVTLRRKGLLGYRFIRPWWLKDEELDKWADEREMVALQDQLNAALLKDGCWKDSQQLWVLPSTKADLFENTGTVGAPYPPLTDEQFLTFASFAAPILSRHFDGENKKKRSLLIGVAWGRTLSALLMQLEVYRRETDAAFLKGRVFPVCGEFLIKRGECTPVKQIRMFSEVARASSSWLAKEFDRALFAVSRRSERTADDTSQWPHTPSLDGVPFFFPPGDATSRDVHKKHWKNASDYDLIFDEGGFAEKATHLLFATGTPNNSENRIFWHEAHFNAYGLDYGQIKEKVSGVFGSAFIPAGKHDFEAIKPFCEASTGLNVDMLKRIRKKWDSERPKKDGKFGRLICFSLGSNRALLTLKAIREGLVDWLFIDVAGAKTMLEALSPKRKNRL